MNTYRTHSKLSAAIRSLAAAREELNSRQTTWLGKLVCRCRYRLISFRVNQLVNRLHP